MPSLRPASDSPDPRALALRLLEALPAEVEPRRALRLLLGQLRDALGLAGIALEIPDRVDPDRYTELLSEGAPLPPERADTGPGTDVVTWSIEAGGETIARLRLLDPGDRLAGLDTTPLRALVALETQRGLRGLDLAQRSLFVRCAEHLVGRLAGGAGEADLYETLARCLTEILPIDRVAVFTMSEDRNSLIPWAVSDRREDLMYPAGMHDDPVLDLRAEPRLAEIVRSGRIVYVEDIAATPLPPEWQRLAEARRVRSALALPMTDARGAWGLVLLCRETPGPVLSPLDTELVRLLMQHLAPLLQNARVMSQLQASVVSFRTLLEAGRDISAVLDLWEIPRRVAVTGLDLTGSDEAVLLLIDPDRETLRPVFALSPSEEALLRTTARVGTGFVGGVATARRAVCRNRAPREETQLLGFQNGGSLLAVPLLCADELLGVLVLHRRGAREFSDLDLMVVNVFGTQAAISLENGRLFQSVATERTRLAAMIEQLEEGVVVCDAQGTIQRVNPAARRWLDSPDDPEGAGLFARLRALKRTELAEALAGLGSGGERHLTREFSFGGRVDLVSATAIQGVETPSCGFVLLIRDVTALKTMERQLMLAGKMAAVGQLAGGVAHEFNNLIAAIYGYAQLMRDSSDERIRKKGIEIILSSSERARRLTQNLLTFSRERGDRMEAVELNGLVENTLQLVEAQWRGEGIDVRRQFDTLPETWAPPGGLQEVLLNLLTNARHAIQERGGAAGVITIATRGLADAIEITVTDDGIGIPAADLPRLFDPFFTTKGPLGGRSTPGMGLGLFTVYNILNGLGGRIEVTSHPGSGATFRIHLPVRAERSAPQAA